MLDIVSFLENLIPLFQSPLGIILFVPFYALWVICLLPGLWLTMLAGAIYGTLLGSFIVFIGACIGAQIAFILGRTFLKEWIQSKLLDNPKLDAIQNAINQEGIKLILLTRLSPAFPFSLLNIMYGFSKVSFRNYTFGLIGILPGTFLYCGLGEIAGDLAKFNQVLSNKSQTDFSIFSILGLVATVGVVFLVTRAARNILQDNL